MLPHDLAAGLVAGPRNRLLLPEYRQIELYSKRKTLHFAEPQAAPDFQDRVAGACGAFMALDAFLESQHFAGESGPSWERYLALPRASLLDKLVAELYRVLRVARAVAFHPHGHIEAENGIVKFNGAINRWALTLEITPIGLALLETAVAYYLAWQCSPYPAAYAEAMMAEYFLDISGEIKRFADQDRVLYQFQRKQPFNRHFRFDCDNPKTRAAADVLEIETGPAYANAALYPIDFYIVHDDALHIVPAEALDAGKLPLAQLYKWRARTPDGMTLPAHFRWRFSPRNPGHRPAEDLIRPQRAKDPAHGNTALTHRAYHQQSFESRREFRCRQTGGVLRRGSRQL